MASEISFKRWFRSELKARGIWSEAIEPSRGSGVGAPDLVVLLEGKHLVFLELKIGQKKQLSDQIWVLQVSPIRPAQYSWHRNYQSYGGVSAIVVGVNKGSQWEPFILLPLTQDEFLKFGKDKFVSFGKVWPWDFLGGQIGAFEELVRKLNL